MAGGIFNANAQSPRRQRASFPEKLCGIIGGARRLPVGNGNWYGFYAVPCRPPGTWVGCISSGGLPRNCTFRSPARRRRILCSRERGVHERTGAAGRGNPTSATGISTGSGRRPGIPLQAREPDGSWTVLASGLVRAVEPKFPAADSHEAVVRKMFRQCQWRGTLPAAQGTGAAIRPGVSVGRSGVVHRRGESGQYPGRQE